MICDHAFTVENHNHRSDHGRDHSHHALISTHHAFCVCNHACDHGGDCDYKIVLLGASLLVLTSNSPGALASSKCCVVISFSSTSPNFSDVKAFLLQTNRAFERWLFVDVLDIWL